MKAGLSLNSPQSEATSAHPGVSRTLSQPKPDRQASGGKSDGSHRQDALRGVESTSFLLSKAARLDKALQSLPKADLKALQAASHKRARKVLHSLSYPALPSSGPDAETRAAQSQLELLSRAQNPVVKASTKNVQPLSEVLALGLKAEGQAEKAALQAAQNFALEVRQPLAEDLCSQMLERTGASLDWVDVEGLTATSSAQSIRRDSSLPDLGNKTVVKRGRYEWPSLETFEQFYHIPEELLPPPRPKSKGQKYGELPPARPTISSFDEAKDPGLDVSLLPALLSSAAGAPGLRDQQQRPSIQQPAEPQNVFLATSAYRKACSKLCVQPLLPPPLFGSILEIVDCNIDGTKQCYAIAEAVRTAAPQRVMIHDTSLTDLGTAAVVESACSSGRLQTLKLSGSPLSYHTCLALHTCLRSRMGSSLQELSLAECGLGGDLDEELEMLPGRAASTYGKSRSSLFPEEDPDSQADLELSSLTLAPTAKDKGKGKSKGDENESKDSDKTKPKEAAEAEEDVAEEGEEGEEEDGEVDEEIIPTPVLLPLFAQLARPTCPLRKLDLSRSILSWAAVEALAWALRSTVLEVLILDECGLTDEAFDELAVSGLGQNRMLLELSLRSNNLSGQPGSASSLFDVCGRHARLVHLDLAHNLLPKECVKDLFAMLRWSLSLAAIHLIGNTGNDKNNIAIATACHKYAAEISGKGSTDHGTEPVPDPEPDEGDEFKEVILCRALHVEGLKEWRVTSPAPKPPPEPRSSAARFKPEPVLASWMPACCWICERCSAIDYTWEVPDKGDGDETGAGDAKVFVRPSFANFALVELKRLRIANARRLRYGARMLVPAGQHYHIFEAEVSQRRALHCAESQLKVHIDDAQLSDTQKDTLDRLRRKLRYSGPLNAHPAVVTDDFQIPEDFPLNPPAAEPEADAWAEHPLRTKALTGCYDEDMKNIRFECLCHRDEEPEVRATLREKYNAYYECYALYAGRSQWPHVRQVDIYGVFEEASLLDRGSSGPPVKPTTPSARRSKQGAGEGVDTGAWPPLKLMDVQQMIVQTVTSRTDTSTARTPTTGSGKQAADVAKRTREGAPLTRPQFIEVLLRAAIALRNGEPTAAGAFRRFADEVISARIMIPPLSPFPRGLAIRVGEYSDTLLARRKVLGEAWERFGSSDVAFQRLPQLMKLCDRSFTAKHVASIYALVRRPQPDYTAGQGKRGGQGLRYQDFCEAVARFALVWKRNSNNMGGSQSSSFRENSGHEWPPQPQVGLPVREKAIAARLEGFLAKLAERMRPSI
eukprot:TRINITY_DN38517_c0_g1_i1.p1 TRINITY_DN38517_c0_g1~~TRINITY_DN38517_c0_g1_i1.p1  ORF type:complete len:1281 (+),score=268.42 TRINITY_DN38517_c0_g1_i1:110-3952(+)